MANTISSRWAWEPYRPSKEFPWDAKKVGHLYRRAAFGATAADLDSGVAKGPDQLIDSFFDGSQEESFNGLMEPLAKSISASNNGIQASAWWLYRMLYSPHPLREKLTLFWHNHFATSNAKVLNAGFMIRQYELLRRQALGHFDILLQEISKDPAMLVWLDTRLSKKGTPNENYARELMELFSLGIGHYTETDIREAARAFTGWEIQNGAEVIFDADQHDEGIKTVMGQKGKWQGSDIVRICLDQKAAAPFIVRKLYRFLISENEMPTKELIAPLAEQFRRSDYDFAALVRTVLRSNLFFSPTAYRACIKSPVEFALGIVRALEGQVGTLALAAALQELGQNLFYPPSVKGWDGGPAWLNGHTLLYRQNLALALTSTEDPRFGQRTDPALVVKKHNKNSDPEVLDFFLKLFLQDDLPQMSRARLVDYFARTRHQPVPVYWSKNDAIDNRVRVLCHLVLTLPEFQLN